jgi:hypothetical protein
MGLGETGRKIALGSLIQGPIGAAAAAGIELHNAISQEDGADQALEDDQTRENESPKSSHTIRNIGAIAFASALVFAGVESNNLYNYFKGDLPHAEIAETNNPNPNVQVDLTKITFPNSKNLVEGEFYSNSYVGAKIDYCAFGKCLYSGVSASATANVHGPQAIDKETGSLKFDANKNPVYEAALYTLVADRDAITLGQAKGADGKSSLTVLYDATKAKLRISDSSSTTTADGSFLSDQLASFGVSNLDLHDSAVALATEAVNDCAPILLGDAPEGLTVYAKDLLRSINQIYPENASGHQNFTELMEDPVQITITGTTPVSAAPQTGKTTITAGTSQLTKEKNIGKSCSIKPEVANTYADARNGRDFVLVTPPTNQGWSNLSSK